MLMPFQNEVSQVHVIINHPILSNIKLYCLVFNHVLIAISQYRRALHRNSTTDAI